MVAGAFPMASGGFSLLVDASLLLPAGAPALLCLCRSTTSTGAGREGPALLWRDLCTVSAPWEFWETERRPNESFSSNFGADPLAAYLIPAAHGLRLTRRKLLATTFLVTSEKAAIKVLLSRNIARIFTDFL